MEVEIRAPRADEAEAAYAICSESFTSGQGRRDDWLATKRMDDFLCAWVGGELVATTEAVPVGQHFGGRSVPMGAVASVAVRPDQRGRGLAPRLLAATVEEMHERGLVISTLHPATTRFYRALGWEVAGEFSARRVPSSALVALPHGEPECMRPAGDDDRGPVRECYRRIAPGIDGTVDRNDTFWAVWDQWLARPHHYLYVYDAGDGIDGYVKYEHVNTPNLWGFSITVHELVAATPEAGLTLWRHIGSHAAQVDEVVVMASPLDDLTLLLPEQKGRKLLGVNRWMTRIIDAPGAVEARGFPPGVSLRLDLEVVDRLASRNDDRFVLDVADGRGALRRGGAGGVRMTVNAFASLYTGWASAFTLAAAGLVHHAGDKELRMLDAAFSGPAPYLFDDF